MENEPTNADSTIETTTTPSNTSEPLGSPNPPQSSPANTPAEIPEYSKEAADALNAAYSLNDPAPDTSPSEPEPSAPDNSSDTYTLSFPDSFADHPEAQAYNTLLSPIAQKSGLDGSAFGSLFAEAYSAITDAQRRAEWQNRFQQDAALKKDWGPDYEANMTTARSHITFLKERAGLTDDDLAVFASPKGMRALYAMATAHATPPAAGLESSSSSEKNWAAAVMQPDHPDHDAFTNPLNPRYKEINQRWLRANGQ